MAQLEAASATEPVHASNVRETESIVDRARRRYVLQRARYERTASVVAGQLAAALRQQAIPHLLSFRAKHPDNFAGKVLLKRRRGKYAELGEDLNETVKDLAGVRIVVYDPADESRVADVIRNTFKVADGPAAQVNFALPPYDARTDQTEYKATHVIVVAPQGGEYATIDGACCEVQVCNMAAHVFNEIEHDIRYKLHDAEPTQRTKDALERLRLGCRDLEKAATAVLKAHQRDIRDQSTELLDPEDLRRGLELVADRQLRGDFDTLFKLLGPIMTPLSVTALLHGTGLTVSELLVAGSKRMPPAEGQQWQADDAILLAIGLMDAYGGAVMRVALDWEGSQPQLVQAIITLRPRVPSERP